MKKGDEIEEKKTKDGKEKAEEEFCWRKKKKRKSIIKAIANKIQI